MNNHYVFEGRVIRLKPKDYNDLWQNYVPWLTEGQWLRELCSLDDWLENKGQTKNWYWLLTSLLSKKKIEKV